MHQSVLVVIGGIATLLAMVKAGIDLASTIEYVEQKCPRLVKWSERKGWHSLLLFVFTLTYAGFVYEFWVGPEPPPIPRPGPKR